MRNVFIILLIMLVASQAQVQRSRIVTDTIYSQVLNSPRAYTVYLPPSFDVAPERQYPVLYLLHGLSGKNSDWAQHSQLKLIADRMIRNGEIEEMVIVTPDADEGIPGTQCGYFNMPNWNYEDFFFTEFLPQIEKQYRVKGDKQHRAIAGLSMGGGGTTGYAQHHPEMFVAAYPMSALMQIQPENRNHSRGQDYEILSVSVIDNDHVRFVEEADEARKADLRSVAWYVDCGDDDFLLPCNLNFYRAMRTAGIPCELRVRDGEHNWEYWNTALYECLPFVSRNFKNH